MKLASIQEIVAEKEIRCDASSDLIKQLLDNDNSKFRWRHLKVAYAVKFCKILRGQKYKLYQVVDDEGVIHEMTCVSKLDDYMIRNKLYPEFLIEQINNLKK
jgi:hypothetical protein